MATFNNKTQYKVEFNNGSRSGAYSLDLDKGNKQVITLTGDVALTFSNEPVVGSYQLRVKYSGSGGIITYPSGTYAKGGVAPTLTNDTTKYDILSFYMDGDGNRTVAILDDISEVQ